MAVTRIWDADNGVWQLVGGTVGAEASGAGLYLPIAGGTMSGPLILATNPTVDNQAATKAYVDSLAGGGGGAAPTGIISMFGGATPPTGWLFCDGSVVSRATYATLFAVIGAAYGAGDGSTTFGLPDLRGRFAIGKASTPAKIDTLGKTGGALDHVHSGPNHSHASPAGGHTHGQNAHVHDLGNSVTGSINGGVSTSSDGAHSHNRQPFNTSADSHAHSFSDSDSFSTGGASSVVGSLGIGGGSTTSAASTGHSHSGSVSISGNTSSDSHSHTVPEFNTASVGNHSHTMTGHHHDLGSSVSSGGGTTDAASPSTANAGTGDTGTENPPFQVVNYIIKT